MVEEAAGDADQDGVLIAEDEMTDRSEILEDGGVDVRLG